jgi:hypothetical protein
MPLDSVRGQMTSNGIWRGLAVVMPVPFAQKDAARSMSHRAFSRLRSQHQRQAARTSRLVGRGDYPTLGGFETDTLLRGGGALGHALRKCYSGKRGAT